MQQLGISAQVKRSRKPTTKSDPYARFAPNRLNREFLAEEPKSTWVTDTKAVETGEGWLYLAVVVDLFSRMVVGWAMAATEDEQLVELARLMALATRRPATGLLHHSDRGSECTSDRYQALLREAGFEVSIGGTWSRTGDCYDNAAMEAFFATLTRVVYRSGTLPDQTRGPLGHFRVPGVLLQPGPLPFDVTVGESGCF